jgi:L-amino acid N-acyltransferase YncA
VVTVRELDANDWPEIARIYGEGIATRLATFETEVPDWDEWSHGHLASPRLVAENGAGVVGWAALSATSSRAVYGGVAWTSVYVDEQARGRGVGRRLLDELVAASEDAGIWTLQAAIFPENGGSLALHRRCGFRDVGVRERLARLDGEWRDVLLLERRSPRIR